MRGFTAGSFRAHQSGGAAPRTGVPSFRISECPTFTRGQIVFGIN